MNYFPAPQNFQGNQENILSSFLRRLTNLLARSVCDTKKMIKVIHAIYGGVMNFDVTHDDILNYEVTHFVFVNAEVGQFSGNKSMLIFSEQEIVSCSDNNKKEFGRYQIAVFCLKMFFCASSPWLHLVKIKWCPTYYIPIDSTF